MKLSGKGEAPDVELPPIVDFGKVELGSTGHVSVSVRNTSVLPRAVGVSVEGSEHYAFVPATPRLVLPGNGSATLDVSFTPGTADAHSATLRFDVCDACAERTVRMTGEALRRG